MSGSPCSLHTIPHVPTVAVPARAPRNKICPGKNTPVTGGNLEVVKALGANAGSNSSTTHVPLGAPHVPGGTPEVGCTGLVINNSGPTHESDVTVVRAAGGALPSGGAGMATGAAIGATTPIATNHGSMHTGANLHR